MKKTFAILSSIFTLATGAAFAQMGGQPGGGMPQFGGARAKLFGDNTAFSASIEMQVKSSRNDMTIPGKLAFDTGKARFEVNMADMSNMSQQQVEQMKSMGMDRMVTISRPDEKAAYMVYPGLQSYALIPLRDADAGTNDFKVDITELGKETVDGHPCVKNKVVVTGKDGKPHESTVWNATDLNKFPVKIVSAEGGNDTTMLFREIKLSKPEASLFEAPTGYTKYDNVQTLMQKEMMKKMGGGF